MQSAVSNEDLDLYTDAAGSWGLQSISTAVGAQEDGQNLGAAPNSSGIWYLWN